MPNVDSKIVDRAALVITLEPTITMGRYRSKLNEDKEEMFDAEVNGWIEEGILVPWEGKRDGLLPLMAVEQPTTGK